MASVDALSTDHLQFAKISLSASGDLVTAVSGRKIRVVGYMLICDAAMTAKFQSGASTDLTGAVSIGANLGISYGGGVYAPAFETASGEKLNLVLTGTGNCRGHLVYTLI